VSKPKFRAQSLSSSSEDGEKITCLNPPQPFRVCAVSSFKTSEHTIPETQHRIQEKQKPHVLSCYNKGVFLPINISLINFVPRIFLRRWFNKYEMGLHSAKRKKDYQMIGKQFTEVRKTRAPEQEGRENWIKWK
jgi:hypothetical protein